MSSINTFFSEEPDSADDKTTASSCALATILSKHFCLKTSAVNTLLERNPTYVTKEKSLKSKLLNKGKRVSI